jgi:hypothetical protein
MYFVLCTEYSVPCSQSEVYRIIYLYYYKYVWSSIDKSNHIIDNSGS